MPYPHNYKSNFIKVLVLYFQWSTPALASHVRMERRVISIAREHIIVHVLPATLIQPAAHVCISITACSASLIKLSRYFTVNIVFIIIYVHVGLFSYRHVQSKSLSEWWHMFQRCSQHLYLHLCTWLWGFWLQQRWVTVCKNNSKNGNIYYEKQLR